MKLITRFKSALKKRIYYERNLSVGGTRFRAPVQRGATINIQENWMQDVLAQLFEVYPGAMVDVGVNLGQTLLTMRSIDRDRDYIGFEPNVGCAAYVGDLIRLNELERSQVFPVAVFNRNAVLQLDFINEGGFDSAASVIQGLRPDNPVVDTRSVLGLRVDHFDGLFDAKVGVVKIDVEGAESAALMSLKPVIERDRPVIILEILPAYSDKNQLRIANNQAIGAFCGGINYRIARINGKGGALRFDQLESIEIHGNLDDCDYVLHPSEIPL